MEEEKKETDGTLTKTEAELKQEFLDEHKKLVLKYGYDFYWQIQQPSIIKVIDMRKNDNS